MMTMEEVIELMLKMQETNPKPQRKHKIGLYVELKHYVWYKENYGFDIAEMFLKVL